MKKTIFVILFAAFIYVLGLIPPLHISYLNATILFQSLGILTAGMVLGIHGMFSVFLFLLLAVMGLPMLAGGKGGYVVFLGPTSGYLYGYILAVFIIGTCTKFFWDRLNYFRLFFIALLGTLSIYLIGVPVYSTISNIDILSAIKGHGVFIVGDAIKIVLSTIIAMYFYKHYPLIQVATAHVHDATIK